MADCEKCGASLPSRKDGSRGRPRTVCDRCRMGLAPLSKMCVICNEGLVTRANSSFCEYCREGGRRLYWRAKQHYRRLRLAVDGRTGTNG